MHASFAQETVRFLKVKSNNLTANILHDSVYGEGKEEETT